MGGPIPTDVRRGRVGKSEALLVVLRLAGANGEIECTPAYFPWKFLPFESDYGKSFAVCVRMRAREASDFFSCSFVL